MSNWSDTIKYINSFSNEDYITPKMVKEHLYNNSQTIPLYVNFLHKSGFLKRTNRGVYIRVQKIPSDLTLTQLKKFTYPEGTTIEDRKRNIERYWKLKDIQNNI
jgi:hypothetical protein